LGLGGPSTRGKKEKTTEEGSHGSIGPYQRFESISKVQMYAPKVKKNFKKILSGGGGGKPLPTLDIRVGSSMNGSSDVRRKPE